MQVLIILCLLKHQFDDKLLSIIRDEVITIDSTYMEKIFGNNTAGTAHRGYSRVQGGSYMKDTMRYTTVKGIYFGKKKRIFIHASQMHTIHEVR